jgi:hypothetical protein
MTKTFSQLYNELTESKFVTVYHGSSVKFNKISPKHMLTKDSNAQEGVGIYFGSYETAETYGKHIMKIDLDPKYFIDSYSQIGKHVKFNDLVKICKDMYNSDKESMFYKISDWVYVEEPEDIEDYHIDEFANEMRDEMIRNFTVDFAESFGVENFVKSWNKHVSYIHGTHEKNLGFYSVMNTKYKVEVVE